MSRSGSTGQTFTNLDIVHKMYIGSDRTNSCIGGLAWEVSSYGARGFDLGGLTFMKFVRFKICSCKPFHKTFENFSASLEQPPFVRPGLGDRDLSTRDALLILLQHVMYRTLNRIHHGSVSYPRAGVLLLRSENTTARHIVLYRDEATKPAGAPTNGGKHCAVWVCRRQTLRDWLWGIL